MGRSGRWSELGDMRAALRIREMVSVRPIKRSCRRPLERCAQPATFVSCSAHCPAALAEPRALRVALELRLWELVRDAQLAHS